MQSGLGVVYRGNDPNGIRTRVTAVKGRCPGPLDDRVTKAGQYRNCYSLTQGKSPNQSSALLLLRTKLVNQGRRARGRTPVLGHDCTRIFDEPIAGFTIAEELFDR